MISKATGNTFVGTIARAVMLLLMIVLVRPVRVVAGEPAQGAPDDWNALHDKISRLYNDVLVSRRSPKWTPETDRSAVGQIKDAVTAYVASRLNSSARPSASNLERELNEAMVQAFHGKSLEEVRRGNPSICFAHVLQDDGIPSTLYVAAFATEPSNTPANAIRAFTIHDGVFQLVASTGDEFDNHTLNVIKLRSFAANELRFLVYGVYIGSPEGLTTLTVYRFDGSKLETLWNQDSVPMAEVSLSDDQIVVFSYDQGHPRNFAGPWPSTRNYYAQTPGGLQLVKVEHGEVR